MEIKTVLIVEDHADCRMLLKLVLSRSGYVVVEAATGQEAIEHASAARFDLIVMDFGLPGMTGDKLIRRLKDNPATRNVPVVVTTGYMDAQVAQRAIAAGAESVLLKPYDIEELVEAMERCLPLQSDTDLEAPLVGDPLVIEHRRHLHHR